jgi:hypothetical protein
MLNHKPDSLPVADNLKVTENCKPSKVGEGYWKDISGTVGWRLDVIDVHGQGAAALFVIKGTSSILYAVRLKMADKKISEIETMVVKNSTEGVLFSPQNFKAPNDTPMTVMPPANLLNTRAEMIAIASKYPEAMRDGKKNFNANGLYFTKSAFRLENGQEMATPSNIGTQSLPHLSGMVFHVACVDEEAGIVCLRMNFGPGSISGGEFDVFEAFKVYNDSMHCVLAIMEKVPEGTTFGWDNTGIAMTPPLRCGSMKNGARIVTGEKGVSVHLEFPCDKIMVEIYDVAGKLVSEKSVLNLLGAGAAFVPIPMASLPKGHFIVRLRLFTGGKTTNSILFSLNRTR